jgi:hypothetical protein
MNFKKIGLCILLFLIVGELLVRVDQKVGFLEGNRVVKVATALTITPEYEMLKSDSLDLSDSTFRVMVLGDSYIHGSGIEFKDNFSQQLKLLLQNHNSNFSKIYVLDLSKPSSNTFDNNQAYAQFVDKFKPNVVVLGYNNNDTEGYLNKEKKEINIDSFANVKLVDENESATKKFFNVIYTSESVHYLMTNFNTLLKSYGIVLANSEFSQKLKAYTEDQQSWKQSKVILNEFIGDVKKRDIQFVVLKFPEINLIDYPNLFTESDKVVKNFFTQYQSLIYVDGGEILKDKSSKDYMLSKYDGHMNEKAHHKLAESVFTEIKKNNDAKGWFKK